MESSVRTKNILTLFAFFTMGFTVGVGLVSVEKENLLVLLHQFRGERTLGVAVEQETEDVEEEKEEVVEPEVDLCAVRVDIAGAVQNPGVYCLEKDSAVVDAVQKAGGFTRQVAKKYVGMRVNLASLLVDNGKVYIPLEQDSICQLLEFKLPKEVEEIVQTKKTEQQTTDTPKECVNINSGSKSELETLPGVGPSTAQKIIDNRPYKALEDLLNVSGIGEVTYAKLKEKICL
ncbi:MAG: helix-hairpin-helix domain-containing protein [Candidatus Dojkabacteria bacterium]|jgi:competence protein ComEA